MKEDCIFIIKTNKECRALDDLYCRYEDCPFYKSNKKYNLDGTPKMEGKMAENNKLKPCGNCGSSHPNIVIPGRRYFTFYYVECECGMRTKECNSPEAAVEIWNRRK